MCFGGSGCLPGLRPGRTREPSQHAPGSFTTIFKIVVLGLLVLFGLLAWIARTVAVDLSQLVLWLVSFYLVLVIAEAWELSKQIRSSGSTGG